jgi:hypothetical protein
MSVEMRYTIYLLELEISHRIYLDDATSPSFSSISPLLWDIVKGLQKVLLDLRPVVKKSAGWFGACAAIVSCKSRSHSRVHDDVSCSHNNLTASESLNTARLQFMQLKRAKSNICSRSDKELLISDEKPRPVKQRATVMAPTRSRRRMPPNVSLPIALFESSRYRRIYDWQKHTRRFSLGSDHVDSGHSVTRLFLSSD